MSFCAQCGCPLGAAQFCGQCGTPVAGPGGAAVPAAAVPVNPACTECRGKGCNFCAQGAPGAVPASYAAVETIPTAVFPPGGGGNSYSLGAATSRRDPWERFSWASLPQQYKQNWVTIGYTQSSWDGVAAAPRAIECDFHQLSAAQQRAANLLGYSEHMWNNDIHPDPLPPLSYSGGAMPAGDTPLRGHGPRDESAAGCKCIVS